MDASVAFSVSEVAKLLLVVAIKHIKGQSAAPAGYTVVSQLIDNRSKSRTEINDSIV
jgi:hypothetical protein